MQNAAWQKALGEGADPQRARHYFELLQGTGAMPRLRKASVEQARILTSLLSGSQAMSELLVAHPEWVGTFLDPEPRNGPRRRERLDREFQSFLAASLATKDYPRAYAQLREFKQKEMLRIAARDLARLGDVIEVTREISDLADVCLEAVYHLCWQQATDRLGRPYHLDANERWQPTTFCVIGLGKLGGQELNYSSDVDVVMVYSEEGAVFKEAPPQAGSAGRGLTNHQFFLRLAEAFIAEVTRLSPEGSLFRIDLRLRPEGKAGPLVRSLASYETFYAQWGQTWERMMLIKARPVAGNKVLGAEFLETVQPFRYPRSLSQQVLREIAAMKDRIEVEVVKSGEIERNVKLGRGGIREVEFVAQTLQLLNAGRNPFLQDAQTLSTLQKLARYGLLAGEDAQELSRAYCWLREVEHRLQMEGNRQTHTIPTERLARQRLAALMGCASLTEFEKTQRTHTQNVRRVYESLLRTDSPVEREPLPDLDRERPEWLRMLRDHSFRDPDKACQLVREFVHGPGYVHVSPRSVELAWHLLPKILALCPTPKLKQRAATFPSPVLSDPDRVVARLDSFLSAYGARATLYELWTNNPALFELLLMLFDRSEFLAEIAIRTPDLVDTLEQSGRLRRRKSAEETLTDLRHGLDDADQRLWLRRYHQAELMRIGLRDILGLADFEQNLVELSALADACLSYALEATLRKHKIKGLPFAIIGLGKLGGSELNYGSDLDIMFVADPKVKHLAPLQRAAAEVMDLLLSPTELGVAFQVDARLRPDGEKGLLVNTLPASEEYYRKRAQLWEIQALSRTRSVAGNVEIGRQFQEMAGRLTDFRQPVPSRAAYTPKWKEAIAHMRQRIERERTPAAKKHLAIKTGAGGLMDAEFIAQMLSMAHGWHEPNTLRGLIRARENQTIPSAPADSLIENYRRLRRVEGILRRWSYAGETVLPDDPAPLYRVAVRCGFTEASHFMTAIDEYRAAIRKVYLEVMGPLP